MRIGRRALRPIDTETMRHAMELEPKFEPRVTPNEIGVAVKDGVVTLTGWVLRSAEVDAQRITVEMQGRPCLASSSFPWRSTPTGVEATLQRNHGVWRADLGVCEGAGPIR